MVGVQVPYTKEEYSQALSERRGSISMKCESHRHEREGGTSVKSMSRTGVS